MYGRYTKGGDDTHVHVHAAPPSKEKVFGDLGVTAFVFAMLLVLVVIVIAIQTYKNANNVTTVATTTSTVAVPPSSTTSTGLVDTVVAGSVTVPGYYIGSYVTVAPPTAVMGSTPASGTYKWYQYAGSIDFTAGYWSVTINNILYVDQTSTYIANAAGSNLSNYQMLICLDPNMTTMPDSSTPYSWAANGPYCINGSSTLDTSIDSTAINFEGTGAFYGASSNTDGNAVGTQYLWANSGSITSMPTIVTYVNVPSDVTYYLFNSVLFSSPSSTVTSYNQCPFLSSISWNATRLSNPIPEATLPYSSYFAPATATPTSSSGATATTPTAASASAAYKKATFYGGGQYGNGQYAGQYGNGQYGY